MDQLVDEAFRQRCYGSIEPRPDDDRDEYARDNARIIHSAGFRRLQGKTQVMGVGEGDFHRTRLTHSIETAQIGTGLLKTLNRRIEGDDEIRSWLPSTELVIASCLAHDIGHPPFGHGGERALQKCMLGNGGFEGNAQTLRILVKLEKYTMFQGINPTRRTVLAVLKYPICYNKFDESEHGKAPPKCYYEEENQIVEWALEPFDQDDRTNFVRRDAKGEACHSTLDATIMECADDIAYAVHDLEDMVGRQMVQQDRIRDELHKLMNGRDAVGAGDSRIQRSDFEKLFLPSGGGRKDLIGKLVHMLITDVRLIEDSTFRNPLLRFKADFSPEIGQFLKQLKDMVYELVIRQAELQQLERRGQRILESLYGEILSDPKRLVPQNAWESLDPSDSTERRVCDYLAGMTDSYAERIYQRLFTPGFGSSRDEL